MFTTLLLLGAVVLEGVAIYFAFKAISGSRTSQGAVAWVIFLILAPHFGVPAFLFLGSFKFRGYVIARQSNQRIVDGVAEFANRHQPKPDKARVGFRSFAKVAEAPILSGNSLQLLIDGQETFDTMFAALDAAQDYVLAQFYIIHDDQLGRAFQEKLLACAARGVTVRLLFDSVGCSKLPNTYLDKLKDAGVHVMDAHSLRGPKTRFQINFRNHRKTVVIDGKIGFLGGFNMGDEYMGRDSYFGAWRDTHSVIRGPMVLQLQLVFLEDWYWATETSLLDQLAWQAEIAPENMDGVIVATGPADPFESGSLYFIAAITAARNRIWIASPYFVPEVDIISALKLAAMRGVDVRILMPEMIDHKIPWLAAFAYFDELMDAGVQIWRYNQGFMHQKVIVVDETIASVGTTNLDNRSCRLNFEATAVFFDTKAAGDVADMLEKDFDRAFLLTTRLEDQNWMKRYGAPAARLLAPLL